MSHPFVYLSKTVIKTVTTSAVRLGASSAAALLLRKRLTYKNSTAIAMGAGLLQGLSLALLFGSVPAWAASAAHAAPPLPANYSAPLATKPARLKRADFAQEPASPEARGIADWVLDSRDNHGLPFVIVDKAQAKVFVFTPDGRLSGSASALLGLSLGDDAVPGIGTRKLSTIRPEERTTPAGRFVASLGRNLRGAEILWIDYGIALSMHRVITSNAKERRAQRLLSPSLLDKRISYGCINVPVKFYEKVLSPAFKASSGIVYVLPETRSAHEVFGSYEVAEHAANTLEQTK